MRGLLTVTAVIALGIFASSADATVFYEQFGEHENPCEGYGGGQVIPESNPILNISLSSPAKQQLAIHFGSTPTPNGTGMEVTPVIYRATVFQQGRMAYEWVFSSLFSQGGVEEIHLNSGIYNAMVGGTFVRREKRGREWEGNEYRRESTCLLKSVFAWGAVVG